MARRAPGGLSRLYEHRRAVRRRPGRASRPARRRARAAARSVGADRSRPSSRSPVASAAATRPARAADPASPLGALSGIAVIAVVDRRQHAVVGHHLRAPERPRPRRPSRSELDDRWRRRQRPGRRAGDAVRRRRGLGRSGSTRPRAGGSPTTTPRSTRSARPAERRAARRFAGPSQQRRRASTPTPRTIIESPGDGQAVMIADDGSGRRPDHVLSTCPSGTPAPTSASLRRLTPTPTPSTVPIRARPRDAQSPTGQRAPPASGPRRRRRRPSPSAIAHPIARDRHERRPPRRSCRHRHRRRASRHPRRWRPASPSPATSSSSANRPRSRRTARGSRSRPGPSDGSRGPDVYVWQRRRRVRPPAHDRWVDGLRVVGRRHRSWRAGRDRDLDDERPSRRSPSGSIPATGAESPAGDVWRPVVDPTRKPGDRLDRVRRPVGRRRDLDARHAARSSCALDRRGRGATRRGSTGQPATPWS